MIIIVAGFVTLGWWQLRRAEGGNALSWGYTFEWPLFAGFVVVFWLKVMRDELRESQARERGEAPTAPPVRLPAGIGVSRNEEDAPGTDIAADGVDPGNGGAGNGGGAGSGEDELDEELAAYNAYLSRLNAEASRSAGGLAARNSRRRAAAWAKRPGRAGKAGSGAHQVPGDSPQMEV